MGRWKLKGTFYVLCILVFEPFTTGTYLSITYIKIEQNRKGEKEGGNNNIQVAWKMRCLHSGTLNSEPLCICHKPQCLLVPSRAWLVPSDTDLSPGGLPSG